MNLSEYVLKLKDGMAQDGFFGMQDSKFDSTECELKLDEKGLPGCIFDLLYSRFDGQEGPLCIFGEYRLLSFEEALKQRQDYWENFSGDPTATNDPRVRNGLLWRNLWFPFAWDDNNNRILVLDFDPPAQGTFGQVWVYDCRDAIGSYFLSNSIEDFLNSRFSEIEATGFEQDGEYTFKSRIIPFD